MQKAILALALVGGFPFADDPPPQPDPATQLDQIELGVYTANQKLDRITEELSAIRDGMRSLDSRVKKLEEARNRPSAALVVPQGQTVRRWTHPGNTRDELIAHLRSGVHAGRHSEAQLRSMSYAELEYLHSLDHEQMTAPAVVRQRSVAVYRNDEPQWYCENGRCWQRKRRR